MALHEVKNGVLGYPFAMRFTLIDDILEQEENRIVVVKNVTNAEEYLQDHFPTFPVLPGVLMLEVLVQAARRLLGDEGRRHVLGKVSATRYGTFVQPGESMWAEVELVKGDSETGFFQFKGLGRVHSPGKDLGDADTCVSSRFTMRPMRIGIGGVTPTCSGSTVTSE